LKSSGQPTAFSDQHSADSRFVKRFRNLNAMGLAREFEYHPLLARDPGMPSDLKYTKVEASVTAVKRMLSSLILKLKTDR
jgi:hypothetical protein